MFRKHLVLLVILISGFELFSQEKKDLGIQLGSTYYMGDYNSGTPFYQPSPALGVMFKYNFNTFYTLRISAAYGGLKGSYNVKTQYLPEKVGSFHKRLIEAEAMGEINFLAFDTQQYKKHNFSPYFIFGIGMANPGNSLIVHFPVGVGAKICVGSRTALGLEWRFHKTLTDKIDDYQNTYEGSKAIAHNNDWFSFAGVYLTYRLYDYGYECPAYR